MAVFLVHGYHVRAQHADQHDAGNQQPASRREQSHPDQFHRQGGRRSQRADRRRPFARRNDGRVETFRSIPIRNFGLGKDSETGDH